MTTVETLEPSSATYESIKVPHTAWQIEPVILQSAQALMLSREWYDLNPVATKTQDNIQTEVFPGERLYLLSRHCEEGIQAGLVMTLNGTIGWVDLTQLEQTASHCVNHRTPNAESPTKLDHGKWAMFKLITNLMQHTPYVWGGNSVSGTDCSGFNALVCKELFGLYLPRNSELQRRATAPWGQIELSRDDVVSGILPELEPDVVHLFFFLNENGRAYHTGLTINGQVWDMDEDVDKIGRRNGLVCWSFDEYCQRALLSRRFASMAIGRPVLGIAMPEA